MGKSKGLEKLQFKFRAKGRHGTHSPFVYAFVEKVLRCKTNFSECPEKWNRKDWNLLNATLRFLNPDKVIVCGESFSDAFCRIQKSSSDWEIIPFQSLAESNNQEDIFVFAGCSEKYEDLLNFSSKREGRFSIYFFHPHSVFTSEDLLKFIQNASFQMALDFWNALLLVHSEDFKEKQFFELR